MVWARFLAAIWRVHVHDVCRPESSAFATGVALPRDWSRFGSRLESPWLATGVALPRDWSRFASRLESPWLATGVALARDWSRLASRLESPCLATKIARTIVKGGENRGFGKEQPPPRAWIVCTSAARVFFCRLSGFLALQLKAWQRRLRFSPPWRKHQTLFFRKQRPQSRLRLFNCDAWV